MLSLHTHTYILCLIVYYFLWHIKSNKFTHFLRLVYNEGELQYFGNCIIPYVRKQEEINEIQKQMFNAYQNCVIYNVLKIYAFD